MEDTQWYKETMSQCDMYAHRFALSPDNAKALQEFVLSVAKEQFKMGSRSGILWMKKQAHLLRPIA